MSRVAVVTDSASDLPSAHARAAGITVVPLTVAFGSRSFPDEGLSPDRFWALARASPDPPTTASPSPEALREAYAAAAGAGSEAVVSVHLSAHLSRTVETASLAAHAAPVPVEVVDSRSVSMGQGLVALEAARAAAAGGSAADVAGAARSAAERLAVVAVLDTVEFLKRGGRVSAARAALSDLLRIRPVLALDDGRPVLAARPRTRARGIEEAVARVEGPAEAVAVFDSGAPEAADVAERLRRSSGIIPLRGAIGPVTGAHLGPRALGIAVVRERSGRAGRLPT